MSLPELLQEAEEEIINRSMATSSGGSPRKSSGSSALEHADMVRGRPVEKPKLEGETKGKVKEKQVSSSSTAPRNRILGVPVAWAKEDWKNMERCFVRERKHCAALLGVESSRDIPPEDVDLDSVVDRFLEFLHARGEWKLGPDWER
jgi:hypothetical protein